MEHVALYEAKAHLSELAARAAGGEEIIITRYGKPYAMMTMPHGRPGPARPTSRPAQTREERQKLARDILALREEIIASGGGVTSKEIVEMIREDRDRD